MMTSQQMFVEIAIKPVGKQIGRANSAKLYAADDTVLRSLVGREGIGTDSKRAERVSTANIFDHFPKQLVIVRWSDERQPCWSK
jgi:hypothetical protein